MAPNPNFGFCAWGNAVARIFTAVGRQNATAIPRRARNTFSSVAVRDTAGENDCPISEITHEKVEAISQVGNRARDQKQAVIL